MTYIVRLPHRLRSAFPTPHTETFYQDSLASFLPYLAFCFVLYLLWIRHALFRTNQGLRYTLDTLLLYILPFFALLNMNYARCVRARSNLFPFERSSADEGHVSVHYQMVTSAP